MKKFKVYVVFLLYLVLLSFNFSDSKDTKIYSYSFKITNSDDFKNKSDLDVTIIKIFGGKIKSKLTDFNSKNKKYEVITEKNLNEKQVESSFQQFKIIFSDLKISYFSQLTSK